MSSYFQQKLTLGAVMIVGTVAPAAYILANLQEYKKREGDWWWSSYRNSSTLPIPYVHLVCRIWILLASLHVLPNISKHYFCGQEAEAIQACAAVFIWKWIMQTFHLKGSGVIRTGAVVNTHSSTTVAVTHFRRMSSSMEELCFSEWHGAAHPFIAWKLNKIAIYRTMQCVHCHC